MTAPRDPRRFLLARPRGGLNDTLHQIELCLRHAETFDRTLVLDLSCSRGFRRFERFFQWKMPMAHVEADPSTALFAELNGLPCRPAEVTGKLTEYRSRNTRFSDWRFINCLEGTAIPLSSDLSRDYPEPVLLHDSRRGGNVASGFLQRVTLEPALAREIVTNILSLGPDYAAIHIRHTDFRTNEWRSFLKSIRGDLRGRTVLLCSDNAEVIEGACLILNETYIRTVTKILKPDGRPLHHWTDGDQPAAIQLQRNSLIDLFCLAAASDLFWTVEGQLQASGFSHLAGALCVDRALLASLLGGAPSSINPIAGQVHQVISWKTKALRWPRQAKQELKRLAWVAAKAADLRLGGINIRAKAPEPGAREPM